jgi:phosphoglycerate dehydrogenase-like enzyme
MKSHRVAFIGAPEPEILDMWVAELPDEFEMVVTRSPEEQEKIRLAADADFILVSGVPLSAAVISAPPNLKLIQKLGVGYDNIDLRAAAGRGVPVAVSAGVNSVPVAELTVGLMIAVYRHIAHVDRMMRQGAWQRQGLRAMSHQISGKTVGLVGFGNIAQQVARRLSTFDAKVVYFARARRDPSVERQLGVEFRPLDQLLSEADIISLHVPLTPETQHLIDARAFSLMKPGAVVINTCRGAVIDEAQLINALRSGTIMGAGLDTFATEPLEAGNPLLTLDNVVLTPHVGGMVIDTVPASSRRCFGNMLRVLRGEPIAAADLVPLPDIP